MKRRINRTKPRERPRFTEPDDAPLLSGYRAMWLVAMFDLPVTSKAAKKRAARFRKDLVSRGFHMLQWSVYARYCASEAFAEGIKADVRSVLPSDGQVRLLGVTDRQYGKMEVFFGKKRLPTEDPPPQLMLF